MVMWWQIMWLKVWQTAAQLSSRAVGRNKAWQCYSAWPSLEGKGCLDIVGWWDDSTILVQTLRVSSCYDCLILILPVIFQVFGSLCDFAEIRHCLSKQESHHDLRWSRTCWPRVRLSSLWIWKKHLTSWHRPDLPDILFMFIPYLLKNVIRSTRKNRKEQKLKHCRCCQRRSLDDSAQSWLMWQILQRRSGIKLKSDGCLYHDLIDFMCSMCSWKEHPQHR